MPRVAVLEELAPGRTLVQIVGGTHDGRQVVVMGAGRQHATRALAWYLDGDEPPEIPFMAGEPSTAPTRRASTRPRPSAALLRATALLESLLTPEQRSEWRRTHRFWVPTPFGDVQLGYLYHLDFRPSPPARPLVLCVVPVEPRRATPMPQPDVWTNLLLVLHEDPERFFRVANWRPVGGGSWRPGPAPVPPASATIVEVPA